MKSSTWEKIWVGTGLAAAAGFLYATFFRWQKKQYPPGSADQIALFTAAARKAGLSESWGASVALQHILEHESDGWVGQPNYTYPTWRDHSTWPAIWAELRRGVKSTRSSASGLGQLILDNVDKYYPSGRQGIGDALEEAVGMLRYIADRYGTPERAWELYGKLFAGY